MSVKRVGDVLLAVSGVLVALKVTFRRDGEFFLTTADYLTLALCVFFAISSQHNALGFDLNGPLFRGVVAVVVLRTLCSRSQPFYRHVAIMLGLFLTFSTTGPALPAWIRVSSV